MVMFDGLPLHPLIVHAPVVLIPLVAVGLGLLLVRPSLRATLAPIVAVLAVGAAITSMGAAWSGEQLGEALGHGDELDPHETWGELTRNLAVIVAVGAVGFAAANRFLPRRPAATRVLGIATTGLAIAAVGVMGVAGHAGATLAWEGKVPTVATADLEPSGGAPTGGGEAVGPEVDRGATADSGGATSLPPDAHLPGTGIRGVDVSLGEWALIPSVERAPPGAITFRFHNLGAVPHALRIRTPGSGGDRLEWRSETIGPGEVGLLVADLAPGTYEIDCPVEDGHGEHDQLGMEMRFTVGEDAESLLPLPSAAGGPQADADDGDGETGAPPAPETVSSPTIEIRSFAFEPAELQVSVGAEVIWINHDPAPHTATGDGFDTGRLEQGARATITFTESGSIDYVCAIHPAMRARVTVVPP